MSRVQNLDAYLHLGFLQPYHNHKEPDNGRTWLLRKFEWKQKTIPSCGKENRNLVFGRINLDYIMIWIQGRPRESMNPLTGIVVRRELQHHNLNKMVKHRRLWLERIRVKRMGQTSPEHLVRRNEVSSFRRPDLASASKCHW